MDNLLECIYGENWGDGFKTVSDSLSDIILTGNQNSDGDINAYSYIDNNRILAGPFYMDWSINDWSCELNTSDYFSIKDENGNSINNYRIVNSQGVELTELMQLKGQNFYVEVPSSVSRIQVSVDVQYKKEATTKKGYKMIYYTHDSANCDKPQAEPDLPIQTYARVHPYEKKEKVAKEINYKWIVNVPKGNLRIIKRDVDTGVLLDGAKFKVTGIDAGKNDKFVATVTTQNGGVADIIGLLEGRYKIQEIGAPNGYIFEYQTDIVKDTTVNARGCFY